MSKLKIIVNDDVFIDTEVNSFLLPELHQVFKCVYDKISRDCANEKKGMGNNE